MKKIVFFDIDGTLIDSVKGMNDISPKVKESIKEIQENGDYAFIATGRPYGFLPKTILEFGFDGFILANGAHIIINDKTIYSDSIDKVFIKNLVEELENNNIEYVLQGEKYCYMKKHFKNFHNYLDKIKTPKNYIKDEYNYEDINIHKVEMLCENDEMENLCLNIVKKNPECDYFSSINKRAIEMYIKKNTKSKAILKVINYLNIPIENTYAFGDGKNDMDMLKEVGCGIAMGNASDEVKEIADYVTESVYNDGVAVGIMEKMLKKSNKMMNTAK